MTLGKISTALGIAAFLLAGFGWLYDTRTTALAAGATATAAQETNAKIAEAVDRLSKIHASEDAEKRGELRSTLRQCDAGRLPDAVCAEAMREWKALNR